MTTTQTTATLARPARPATTTEKKTLPNVATLKEKRRFKPATTWIPKYNGDNELIGISWQGEPVAVMTATIGERDVATLSQGHYQILKECFPEIEIFHQEEVEHSIPIDWHYTCQWNSESRTVARSCRQKVDCQGQKQNGIYFPPSKQAKVGDEVTILVVPKGDTRQGYEEALGYYLVK